MRVAVVGATGYAGQEMVRLVERHPAMALSAIVSEHEAGTATDRYFSLGTQSPRTFLSPEDFNGSASVDLIFACQGPKALTENIGCWASSGIAVIDLSADFRFQDVEVYERVYGAHPKPDLIPRSMSGYADDTSMAYRKDIRILGNPGCYPTAFHAAVKPLVRSGIPLPLILVDGKSGVSGAGRRAHTHLLMGEMAENVEPYSAPGIHRHTAEMEQVVGHPVVFQPHLLPLVRGMELTIFLPQVTISANDVMKIWHEYYRNNPFVRVLTQRLPRTVRVRGTNEVEMAVQRDERTQTTVLYVAIDNIGKGAAGQALQHANRWFAWDQMWGF